MWIDTHSALTVTGSTGPYLNRGCSYTLNEPWRDDRESTEIFGSSSLRLNYLQLLAGSCLHSEVIFAETKGNRVRDDRHVTKAWTCWMPNPFRLVTLQGLWLSPSEMGKCQTVSASSRWRGQWFTCKLWIAFDTTLGALPNLDTPHGGCVRKRGLIRSYNM